MKKRIQKLAAVVTALAFACGALSGCGGGSGENGSQDGSQDPAGTVEASFAETAPAEPHSASDGASTEKVSVRIGALKGPTTIGLVNLMADAQSGETANEYEFQMATAADEILPLMVKGDLDIALVPANVASVLYNNTEGDVTVIDINTLGVLYVVSGDTSIESVADLSGRTVFLTGKGTTPDYSLQYLLSENQVTDCTLEYKSEATEVAAVLEEDPSAVGLLPQPFATVACAQNEALSAVLDLNQEWDRVQGEGGSSMVTGVTVVRNAFLEEHPEAVDAFLAEHTVSAQAANDEVESTAELVAEAGIIAKAPIAQKAIPNCNIVCITGEKMKQALAGYLEVLYGLDPASVGGALPEEDFYYVP